MSYLLKITVCLAFCHAYKQKLKLKRLGQLSRDRNKCFSIHTYKAKEGENCQQTALINHASINHILLPVSPSPPLTHQSGSKKMHLWPSSCFGLLLTIPLPQCCLSLLHPFSAPFMPGEKAVWSFMAAEPIVHHLLQFHGFCLVSFRQLCVFCFSNNQGDH